MVCCYKKKQQKKKKKKKKTSIQRIYFQDSLIYKTKKFQLSGEKLTGKEELNFTQILFNEISKIEFFSPEITYVLYAIKYADFIFLNFIF